MRTRSQPSVRARLSTAARRAAPSVATVEPVERRVLLSAGQLDPTFGNGGRLTVPVQAYPDSTHVAAEANGGLIVAQGGTVTRLTATGVVDTSFGSGGRFTTTASYVTPSIVPGGDILLAAESYSTTTQSTQLTLQELTPTGAVATGFGSGGSEVVAGGPGPVVVGGNSEIYVDQAAGIRRLNADGSTDTFYGTDGVANPDLPSVGGSSFAMAVDGQGRVLFSIGGEDGYLGTSADPGNGTGYVVARLTADGSLDTSFGNDGITAPVDDNNGEANGTVIALAPDGTIYTGDNADEGFGDDRLAGIHAYSSSGQLEETLPEPIGDGTESGAFGGVLGMTVQPNGQLVVVGYSISTESGSGPGSSSLFVARYTAVTGTDTGGALDASFDGTGVTTVNYASNPSDHDSPPYSGDVGASVAVATNGDVVVAGTSYEPATSTAAAVSEYTVTAFEGESFAVLPGTVSGTAGSYLNQGNTVANAFDGNLNTFFDGPTNSGDVAGLDLGAPQVIRQIQYAPRSGWAGRMVGGVFQGSNTPDFSSGVDTLYTITAAPAQGVYTTAVVTDPTPFEYVRYVAPNGSFGDVAEIRFLGYAPPAPAVLINGVLNVSGTAGADDITVTGDQAYNGVGVVQVVDVTVNGSTSSFPDDVGLVVVNAGDGNDDVSVQEAYMQPSLPPVVVNGDAGDDTLSVGQGASAVLNGDAGNDTFDYDASYNESPPITVSGGGGDDTLNVTPSGPTYISLDGKPDSNLDGYAGSAGSQFDADIENVYVNAFDGGSTTIIGDALGDTFGVTNNQYGPVSLVGGAGNDTFIATSGHYSVYSSTYSGGAGINTIDYSAETAPLTVYLDGSKPSGTAAQIAAGEGDTFDGTVEEVYGGSGNDLLVAAPGGGDALYGNGGNDTLVAQGGADALFGGDGNDTFQAADGGPTYIDGGAGTDTAYVDATGDTTVNVENVITAAPPWAVLANGVLTVTGTAAADLISVDSGAAADGSVSVSATVNGETDSFVASAGRPINQIVINAGDGNDTVNVDTYDDSDEANLGPTVSISGGAGNDVIGYQGVAAATLDGGDGDDSLTASGTTGSLDVYMYGDAGDDTLVAGSAGDGYVNAAMYGGDGNDTFANEDIDDAITVSGGAGIDTLSLTDVGSPGGLIDMNGPPTAAVTLPTAGRGPNYTIDADVEDVVGSAGFTSTVDVIGNAADNLLSVPASVNATLNGGAGNDTLTGGPGTHYSGGAGTDVVDFSAQTAGLTVYLDGSKPSGTAAQIAAGEGDTFDGTVEEVYGGSGNDLLVAAPGGGDALYGNGGNDTLVAQGGADALFGGDGNDLIEAADGGPTYIDGGAGTDTAYVDATGDTTVNVENVIKPTPTPTPTTTQLTGTTYGTVGSYGNIAADTIKAATDGNLSTFFDAPQATGGNVGIDLGSAKTVTQVKFAPRNGFASRMVGGVFQYSTSPTFASGVTNVYTITAAPASGVLTTVNISAPAERYWRYLGPTNGYCDIAEFQLFGPGAATTPPPPTQLTGTTYGTVGSYGNIAADTIAAATDGNLNTFFDAPQATGGNVGINLGSAKTVTQIKFAPRSGFASRMVGGMFQVSTSMTFSSNVTTVYTITSAPASGVLTTVDLNLGAAYQYWRYIGPANGYCDIAEFQLFG